MWFASVYGFLPHIIRKGAHVRDKSAAFVREVHDHKE